MSFESQSDDILRYICSFIDYSEIFRLNKVSHRFKKVIKYITYINFHNFDYYNFQRSSEINNQFEYVCKLLKYTYCKTFILSPYTMTVHQTSLLLDSLPPTLEKLYYGYDYIHNWYYARNKSTKDKNIINKMLLDESIKRKFTLITDSYDTLTI